MKLSRSFSLRWISTLFAISVLAGRAFADTDHALSDQLAADAALLAPAFVAPAAAPADPAGKGAWGPVIPWTPHIPVTAASLPDGRLLTFSSNERTTFPDGREFTYAAVWNPATGVFTEINNERHDMFCGGAVTLPDGRVFISGGRNTTVLSSIFDYRTNQWSAAPDMNDPRWYNTSVAMPNGDVFTVSGSGGSNTAEVWDAASGWRPLPGVGWGAVTREPGYITIWSPFLFLAPTGKLFHFGPTRTMNWVDPIGAGSLIPSGQTVPGTHYPKEGAWTMYDEGKILVAGGGVNTVSIGGDNTTGSSARAAYTINLNAATPVVQSAATMQYTRQFANSVILPSGEVMVIGGNTSGLKFDDTGSVLTPELWNPRTGTWRTLADMAIPRNYHSVALLLPDGRVWSGGGGLSGNAADHRDAQVFTPPALLKADGSAAVRPTLDSAPARIGVAANFQVSGSGGLAKFAFIKMSAITHSTNTDLRYLELPFTETAAGRYTLAARNNPNVMTPGYWMLFGIAPSGVYSVAKVIQVTTDGAPVVDDPRDQFTQQGSAATLQITGSAPVNAGAATYAATGLPPGLTINPATGLISGTATVPGNYPVGVVVTFAVGPSATTSFHWSILLPELGRGSILREWWLYMGGSFLADLTGSGAYPTNPTGTDVLPSFEAPTDWNNDYGQRLRGFLYAPVSGQYRFWIAGDDESQLFLSTDSNPVNAAPIARVPSWTQSRQWTKYPEQTSMLITLVAGRRYYIEARQKDGNGGDNLAVAWQPPGAAVLEVIPGGSLAPYQAYRNPLAMWSFDEAQWSGAAGEVKEKAGLLANLSGSSSGGATTTSASPAIPGNPGTGRSGRFNGVNQFVRLPGKAAIQSPDFTVAAWVKIDQVLSADWRSLVASRAGAGNALHGFNLYASPDGEWTIATGGLWSILRGSRVVANRWTHLAATFRATEGAEGAEGVAGGTRSLYVDGELVAQDTATYTPVADPGRPLSIGATDFSGETAEYTAGQIDEVCLHAAPLSPADIVQTMNLRHSVNSLPAIAAVGNQSSAVGASIALGIAATDAENNPLTFTATGLPPGLAISATGGVIFGTATTAGTYNTVVTVNDGNGTASAAFTWTINQALTIQPLSGAIAAAGATATLTAQSIGGANPRYTWSFGDGSPDTAWSTSPTTTHVFSAPGRYIISLTAMDSTGRVVGASFHQGISAPLTARRPTASSSIAYESRTTGNARIWVANPDNDTVTVFDAATNAKLAETPVRASPRSVAVAPDGRVWVVCADGAAISILNSSTFAVVQTVVLPRGSRPFGLAFTPAGTAAWVTLENTGRLLRLDPATGAQTGSIDTGIHVRHLSVSADGSRVYISRFITPRVTGEESAFITTTNQGGQVLVIDTAALTILRTLILRHSEEMDTTISGKGIPNYLGAPVISPDGLSAWVPSKQDNIKRGKLRNGMDLTHESAVRAIASRLDLVTQTEDIFSRVDLDNAGMPSAACFDPSGIYAFVALEASRAIAVLDVWNAKEIVRFPVGRAPQGLALSPDGQKLFVQNFMDRTVSIVDVSAILRGGVLPAPTLATLKTIATEKQPAQVLLGKQLFYDAKDNRLALQEYLSCAACHNDGDQDGRTWDFTGFGEGLRNTISLRGHGGTSQGPLHWSGNFNEVQDFERQIRDFAGGTGLIANGTAHPPLGTPNAGRSVDLDALAAYVKSLTVTGASPARANAVSLSPAATAGRTVFQAQNCASCHSGTQLTNSSLNLFANVGTLKPSSGKRLNGALTGLDVPTLRGLWATAPYLHDGSAATLADAIRAHKNVTISAADLTNLVAFLASLDDDAAAPQQFANPGFESPKLGTGFVFNPTGSVWTFSATSGVSTNGTSFTAGNPAAPEGSQVLFLQNTGTARQSVALAAGTYRIRLAAAQRGNTNTTPQTVIVTVDGIEVARLTPADKNYATLDTSAFSFVAGTRVIGLAGLGQNPDGTAAVNNALFIDDLRLVASNGNPVVTVPATQSTVRGLADSLQIQATNPDRRLLSFSASGLPEGLAIQPATGLISGIVSPNSAANNSVVVTVRDGAFTTSASFGWETTANQVPTIINPGRQTTQIGQLVSLQIEASDPEGQPLTYSATGLPAGLTIAPATGLIDGMVAANAAATNAVVVRVDDGLLSTTLSFTWLATAPSVLPVGWSSVELGQPGLRGPSSYLNGIFTISGSGAGFGGTTDHGQFVWTPFTGNGEYISRITSLTNPNPGAKAGIMLRETLQANARYAFLALTPNPGLLFQSRTITAGATSQISAASYPAPNNWVRLVRNGDTLVGYRSANGSTWMQVGLATIPMSTTISAGLAVTSGSDTATSTATFDRGIRRSTTLPKPWTPKDIGNPAFAEIERTSSGTYTISGGGAGLVGASDQIHTTTQTLNGNGEIIARVLSQSGTATAGRAGIILRQSSAANAPSVALVLTPASGILFQTRLAVGGLTNNTSAARFTAPNNWLRLVRAGNVFTAYLSSNGISWTAMGSATVPMPLPVQVGFVVTAQNNTQMGIATFDNVKVTPAP